jgi:hypothetical protein
MCLVDATQIIDQVRLGWFNELLKKDEISKKNARKVVELFNTEEFSVRVKRILSELRIVEFTRVGIMDNWVSIKNLLVPVDNGN